VAVKEPFAGALVPASRYHRDSRVRAVMVEVNRNLYLSRESFAPKSDSARIAAEVMHRCMKALNVIRN
jgi:N-formylglutamate amidohydrolase